MTTTPHYETAGPEDGPAVILAPSLGTDLTMWDAQVEALSDRFHVIRYDLRGHGKTSAIPEPHAIEDLGTDLLSLLGHLQLQKAALCGVSIGGMAAMWAAAHAPDRVERLVVCCSSAFIDPPNTYRDRAQEVRKNGLEPIADAVLARWFTPAFTRANPDVTADMRSRLTSADRDAYAGCCDALAAMDLRPDLKHITAPTLVISGADDQATPPKNGEAIKDAIPQARFEIVPSAAHLANVEQPTAVTELIINHLRRSG